ncbi:STAS domain-containing protein [Streptosporangium sp. NPDC050855]|uniref:STAS domain-containing protein n=1 Tax=Streptosporangium sp. NPDC050855 TaxID=3366194 RepID=UPI0037BA4961
MGTHPSDELAFTVDLGEPGSHAVVHVRGELDWNSAPTLTTMVEHLWDFLRDGSLILDLSPMTFCDSMGLGTLIEISKGCRARQVRFVLAAPPPSLCRTLRITGLNTVFELRDTLGEALEGVPRGLGNRQDRGDPGVAADRLSDADGGQVGVLG